MTTSIRLGRLAVGLVLVGALGACAVTPKPLGSAEIDAHAADVRVAATANQEPVAGPIDLYEAMARALRYNLDYKVEELTHQLRNRELNLSTYDMLPQLVSEGGYFGRSNYAGASSLSLLTDRQSLEPSTSTEKNVFSGDLSLSWDILDFGLSYVRANQKADEVLVQVEERRKVANRIIEDVRTSYYRAVSAQRLLEELNTLQGAISTTLANSERLARNRESTPLIALTYQRELIEIETQVKALSRELQIAKAQLAALMNLEPGASYQLVLPARDAALPPAPFTAEQEIDTALRNRPELRQIDYQQRINKRELDAKILAAFPSLKGFVGVNTDSNDFLYHNNWVQYGARASWNLLSVFRLPAEKKAVHAQDDVLRAKSLATAMAVMTQVEVARARYALYGSELDTARHQHAIQVGIMGQINGGYKAGAISQQTLLREQMNSLVTEVKLDIAYANAQNAYANLYAAMGLDNYTPNIAPDRSVRSLAGDLRAMWASRETFAQAH